MIKRNDEVDPKTRNYNTITEPEKKEVIFSKYEQII